MENEDAMSWLAGLLLLLFMAYLCLEVDKWSAFALLATILIIWIAGKLFPDRGVEAKRGPIMETTREALEKRLAFRELSQNDIREIMEKAIPEINSLIPEGKEIWDKPADQCSYDTFDLIWEKLRFMAIEWIRENKTDQKAVLRLFE